MRLTVREFLQFFYWSLIRRPRRPTARHMLGVLPGFAKNAVGWSVRLRFAGRRRPLVAIALLEHMGDIVAAEPLARLARRRFPDARICWITRAPYASLPAGFPEVDQVFTVGCLTEWMFLLRLKLFDVVWDLHVNERTCESCLIPQIRPDVLPNMKDYYDHGNLLDIHCISAGLPKIDDAPIIAPPPAAVAVADSLQLPHRFIVIHCKSNDPRRDWPQARWRALVTRILATGQTAVVEVGLQALVVREEGLHQLSLCGKLSILETAEVIRRADLFIGVDSGPSHLANAVSTPGVILLFGLFGGFQSYMPYSGGYQTGENATILRSDGPLADLSVDAVFEAVMARLWRAGVADNGSLIATQPDAATGSRLGTSNARTRSMSA